MTPAFRFDSLPLSSIHPDPNQPRKVRNPSSDQELESSMNAHGMLQTILVRENDGQYMIVNGERRWSCASNLGWDALNCLVVSGESQIQVIQLIENIQREDLSPEDLANHLYALKARHEGEDKKATIRILSELIGKSAGWVSEKLALAALPAEVKALKENNTVKNSRVLIGLSKLHEQNPEAAVAMIEEINEGKVVTPAIISQVRGTQRKKPTEPEKESVSIADLPSTPIVQASEHVDHTPEAAAAIPASNSIPAAEIVGARTGRRKRKVVEVTQLIGVSEDMPAEELIEVLAEAYANLLAERAAQT